MTLKEGIGKYLLEHPELKQKMDEKKVTMDNILEYVNETAQKKLDGKNGAVSDEEVYGWVVHYIEEAGKPLLESPVINKEEKQLDLFESSQNDTETNKEVEK